MIGDVAVMEAVIGVIALPTIPVADDGELATASGVVKVVAVEVSPAPLLFIATDTTE